MLSVFVLDYKVSSTLSSFISLLYEICCNTDIGSFLQDGGVFILPESVVYEARNLSLCRYSAKGLRKVYRRRL